jgi:Helix-turn-helix domain
MTKLLTEPELADVLSLCKRNLQTLRYARLIPFIRLGRSIRYNPEDVRRALEKLTVKEVS